MELVQILPLLAIVVLFWLLIVRPASRRQREVQRLQASLAVGQRVMLASGLFGTIASMTDDRLMIALAPGVEVEAVRGAVSAVDEHGPSEVAGAGPDEVDLDKRAGDADGDGDSSPER